MLENILKSEGAKKLQKSQQRSIRAGFGNDCSKCISTDGTLCLCLGWIPQNGICVDSQV